MEATLLQDFSIIAKGFQKKMMAGASEEEVMGGLLPSVAMMQVNAESGSGNLLNSIAPPIPDGILNALAAASEAGPRVTLPGGIPELPRTGNEAMALGLEWLQQCIPCALRLQFRADLTGILSDTLLRTMQDMLNNYLKELAFIMNILNSAEVYQDACIMLNALNAVCIPDLQRIISLLSAVLYRQTSKEIMANVDVMKLLILPIFQPIFTNLTQLFGQYRSLITDPLQCVVANLGFQLRKIKTGAFLATDQGGFMTDGQIFSIEERTDELQSLVGIDGTTQGNFNREEVRSALKNTQTMARTYDEGINNMQNSLGTAVFHLRRMVLSGIVEVETILADLERELTKFVGGSQRESVTFLLKQYDRLVVIRMIQFISAMIQAMSGGFSCEIPNEESANVVLAQFFTQFLGPRSPVVVTIDPRTNQVQLQYVDPGRVSLQNANQSLGALSDNNASAPLVIEPTGNNEVDQAVSAIINQAAQPVTIKPKCFFQTQESDDTKLMQFLAQLDATEV